MSKAKRHKTAEHLLKELVRVQQGVSIMGERIRERTIARLKGSLVSVVVILIMVVLGFAAWFYHARSGEEALRAEFREYRLYRMGVRHARWSARNWEILERAARLRRTPELMRQAAATLAGWDAELIADYVGAVGGSAAFAPDGTGLVGGDAKSAARVIDASGASHELPATGEGPVAWSPQGEPLQLRPVSNGFALFDLRTGNARQTVSFMTSEERIVDAVGAALALTPDGQRAAAGVQGTEGHARLVIWDVAASLLSREVSYTPRALAFSADVSVLAAGDQSGRIRLYELPECRETVVLPSPLREVAVNCLVLTRDMHARYDGVASTNSWLVAAGYEGGDIVIWDTHTRLPRATCRGSPWTVLSLAIHAETATLASAGRSEVFLWDLIRGRPLLKISGSATAEARALAFSVDGTRLLWGTRPGASYPAVNLWKLSPHRGIKTLNGLTAAVRKVWFSPDGRLLAGLSDNWHLALWETDSGRLLRIFEAPTGILADSAAGAYDAGGERFAFATGTQARVYDLATGHVLAHWPLPLGKLDQMQFDATGRLLLARSEARQSSNESHAPRAWRLYELEAESAPALLHSQPDADYWPLRLAFSEGARFLLACGARGEFETPQVLRAYEVSSGRPVWRRTTSRTKNTSLLAVDPHGRKLVFLENDSDVPHILSLPDFTRTGPAPEFCGAIGPLPAQFAARLERVWHVTDREHRREPLPLNTDWDAGHDPQFSPDGLRFAWGTFEGPVLLADLKEVARRLQSLGASKPE